MHSKGCFKAVWKCRLEARGRGTGIPARKDAEYRYARLKLKLLEGDRNNFVEDKRYTGDDKSEARVYTYLYSSKNPLL